MEEGRAGPGTFIVLPKAIEGMDSQGVLSQSDFEAINAGLGKAIASVPTGTSGAEKYWRLGV